MQAVRQVVAKTLEASNREEKTDWGAIKETIRAELPAGFQTSEFLLEHGFIDRVVPRGELKKEIARLLASCAQAAPALPAESNVQRP